MQIIFLSILIVLQTCTSMVIFELQGGNNKVKLNTSYLLGTVHVPHSLIWPYFSNETLRIINKTTEFWFEQDFTDWNVSTRMYECSLDKMSIKTRSRLRAKTWSTFLNQTKQTSSPNRLSQWKKWFGQNEHLNNDHFWRNKTIDNSLILDHRLVLEAYQRNATVGSLEPIPSHCPQKKDKEPPSEDNSELIHKALARVYNCDLIDEDFIDEMYYKFDFNEMKKRNKQITEKIRELLTNNPQEKYLFAVGAAHLFGNISIIQMLEDQYKTDYFIQRIDLPSPNFPYENCTDEEFQKLFDQIQSENKTIKKRFFEPELLV